MSLRRGRSIHPRRRKLVIATIAATCALIVGAAISTSTATASSPPAPAVSAVSPNDGPPAGGTKVTITGINFTGATAVEFVSEFGQPIDASSFTVNSDTEITAVSPAGQGVADIMVVGPGGTSATGPQDRFGYGPILDEMTPRNGPAVGGTAVTLGGFGLEGATGVDFGPHPAASFSENSDGTITAVSPPFVPGETIAIVTVTTPEGPSATYTIPDAEPVNFFSYGPTITGVDPSVGAPGTSVTIHGSGFTSSPIAFRCLCGPFVHRIDFGSTELRCGSPLGPAQGPCTPVNFTVISDTEITATAPPGTGTVDLQVVTDGGASPATPADRFTYEYACAVTAGAQASNNCGPPIGVPVRRPQAKILSNQAFVNRRRSIKLLIRCVGERGSHCTGSIGLMGIPRSRGAGKVRTWGGRGRFTLAAGSQRQIFIHLLRWTVAQLQEVRQRKVRASIRLHSGQPSSKDIVLRWRPDARQRPARAVAASAPGTVKPPCGPLTAKTLVANGSGRVYELRTGEHAIFGCLVSTTRSVKLSPIPRSGSRWGAATMSKPFALNAPWVAGAVHQQTGLDTSRITVVARDLRSGRRRSCPAGGGDHSPRSRGDVKDIALKHNGSLAWSGHTRIGEIAGAQFPPPAIVACDSTGEHVLDSGQGIDLHSLALHGSMLTWIDAGETRSAVLH